MSSSLFAMLHLAFEQNLQDFLSDAHFQEEHNFN